MAVNSCYTGGLVPDIMAAIGYLTGRWLGHRRKRHPSQDATTLKLIYYTWLGLSVFVPMPLLAFGTTCMMARIYTYTWTQHSKVVAGLVTFAGDATIPFVVGDFYIGKNH